MVLRFSILNLTPDSFSDGDIKILEANNALNRARAIIEAGAAVIDIGAESTRPGAEPISADEEWARLKPFISNYNLDRPLSLDSSKPEIIKRALYHTDAFAYINDVSGLHNPDLVYQLAEHAENSVKFIAMHSKGGVPPSLKAAEVPDDFYKEDGGLLEHMQKFFQRSIELCADYGIDHKRIILDPGLGFGKNLKHSLEILELIPKLKEEFDLPILIGASRKGFLKLWKNNPDASLAELDQWSEEYKQMALSAGADIIRTHKI